MKWPSERKSREDDRLEGRGGADAARHHTLLWEVQRRGAPVDCKAWEENGAVRVLVRLQGRPQLTGTFSDSALAVEWARSLEQTLIAHGWGKVI